MGKSRTNTSGGTRHHCSSKLDCWIRETCRSWELSRPGGCCGSQKDTTGRLKPRYLLIIRAEYADHLPLLSSKKHHFKSGACHSCRGVYVCNTSSCVSVS